MGKAALTLPETMDMFIFVSREMENKKDLLTQADKAIGDGDHGIGMARGFEAVRSDWSEAAQEGQKAVLNCLLREPGAPIERGIKAKRITLGICRSILETPVEELKPKVQILGRLRNPNRYKSRTPAVAAFLHYAKEEALTIETDWKTFDKFPYVIVPSEESDAPLYKRARHPDLVSEIDRWHYVGEIIRAVERFGVILTLEEVKQKRILLPLEKFIQGL